jgi:hypothetical protein
MSSGTAADPLGAVLEQARALGFLGPGAIADHVEHSLGFLPHLPVGVVAVADIGSGGGVPGLVLAMVRPDLRLTLIDVRQGRADFLVRAVGRLGAADRCQVVCGAVEALAHDGTFRETFDVVTARAFGPLSWTLECASGLVGLGGRVVVSVGPRVAPADTPKLGLTEVEAASGFRAFERVEALARSVPRRSRRPR